jgi:hypothetical protein
MFKKDLPELSESTKQAALQSLARAGLELADCVTFFAQYRTEEELGYVKEAQEHYHISGNLEVDDVAQVSMTDNPHRKGAYVSAWMWVPKVRQQT